MGTLGKNRSTVTTVLAALLLSAAVCCLPGLANAKPADVISNTAVVEYGADQSLPSNTEQFEVQELTDLNLIDLNAVPVGVATPSEQLLSFRLEHSGNGNQSYLLEVAQSTTDDFDATNLQLWLDSDGDGAFDETLDSLYDPANLPLLGPGETLDLFVRLDVPANQSIAAVAEVSLTATANDVGDEAGTPGSTIADAGDSNTDLVIGANGAQQTVTAVLRVNNNAALEIEKRVSQISDPQGGSEPVPGAHIRYELTVIATGEGLLTDVVIRDVIPANTDYRADSLTLDGVDQSDVADTDAGQFDAGNNQILVELGDVTAPGANQIIQFQVTIK